jgi:hypothetical protein
MNGFMISMKKKYEIVRIKNRFTVSLKNTSNFRSRNWENDLRYSDPRNGVMINRI